MSHAGGEGARRDSAVSSLDVLAVPLTGTVLIEASAGTGKTHTLTTLYLRLLLEKQLSVEQILVVTYTNAATAELRARIRYRLHRLLLACDGASSEDPQLAAWIESRRAEGRLSADRNRLLAALYGFDQAAIFTIHGFCQRMLHEHAFETGVPFELELITDQRALLQQVVDDFWVRALHDASPELVAHAHAQGGRKQLMRIAQLVNVHSELEIVGGAEAAARTGSDEVAALQNDWRRLQIECAEYVIQELQRRKLAVQQQSFDDLLQQMARALRAQGGTLLAERVRSRLSAALIDEFQDTDPLQYEIFRRLYHDVPGAALFLIGDPKQAIYSFRGADIFAYIGAKRDAAQRHTLGTNWRSDPGLVRAVNCVFAGDAPFVLADIPFEPAKAAPAARDVLADSGAAATAPFEILFLRRDPADHHKKSITKAWADQHLARLVAAEIVRFVQSGATIDGRPVAFADIAVLCRRNTQAADMQAALQAIGVPSVLQSEASVFDTREAGEVRRLLTAMVEPTDTAAIRAALATAALGQTATQLYQLQSDELAWDQWLQRFQSWNDTWLKNGFISAFRGMLESQAVVPRLLALIDGERRLTNVLHLMELLHGAGIEARLGPRALAHWLGQMCDYEQKRIECVGESAQIRLESDEAAVKLVTIHKSKGLQYPIVYCPYLWDGALLHNNDKKAPCFHDPEQPTKLRLDLGAPPLPQHLQWAERELFAENLRLLYVALTRAQHRCSVVWGGFRAAADSALGYALHGGARTSAVGEHRNRLQQLVNRDDDVCLLDELEQLAVQSDGAIGVRDLPRNGLAPLASRTSTETPLQCRRAERRIALHWRVASFSSLVRGATSATHPAEEGRDYDVHDETGSAAPVVASAPVTLHDFPSGTRAGQFLHTIFEHVDFSAADAATIRGLAAEELRRSGIDAGWLDQVVQSVSEVLDTRLTPHSFSLRQITLRQRLSELEFLFPVALGERAPRQASNQLELVPGLERARLFTPKRLAEVFAAHAQLAGTDYANRLAQIEFGALDGFLKGFVDLVFEHEGRWYVVDYKSNRLGPTPADYTPPRLWPEMARHHYVLQYHLYAVALHRYLHNRLPKYDYERDFGGVFYLFLRGMAPTNCAGNGIYYDRPSRRLIERLSRVLDGEAR